MPEPIARRALLQAGVALPFAAWTGVVLAQSRERLVVRIERDIQNLDPAERPGAVEGNVIRALCRNLVAFRRGSFEIENDAARTIRQTDPTTIDFALEPGLVFPGDFGRLTAEDVKFSYERFQLPGPTGRKPAYAEDWAALDHVEVTGELTGRLILKRPSAGLWKNALADVSGAIQSRLAAAKPGRNADIGLVGAGPYVLAEWLPNRRLVLRRNPEFRGEAPAFEEIVLRPVADPTTAILGFEAGELQLTRIEANDRHALAEAKAGKLIDLPSINFVWLGINMAKPPLDDPRVRRAIRLGIDVDEVITAAYDGTVERARAVLAPGMLGYWPDAPAPARDPAAARALLAEAGRTSLRATLTLLDKPAYRNAAEVIQARLGEIGIALDLLPLDDASYWSSGAGASGQALELFLGRFGGKADPGFITQWFLPSQIGSWNWQRWNSPDYAELYARADREGDVEKRAALYVEMQRLMDQSGAFVPLTHETNIYLAAGQLDPAILPNGDDLQYPDFRLG
jgi:peptide/nickel transport system substrate-binding protein